MPRLHLGMGQGTRHGMGHGWGAASHPRGSFSLAQTWIAVLPSRFRNCPTNR